MKNTILLFVLLFILSPGILHAQEQRDSSDILKLLLKNSINIPHFKYVLPSEKEVKLFSFDTVSTFKRNKFPGKELNQFKLIDNIKYFPNGEIYMAYTSPNNALHYFSKDDPVNYSIDFHLQPMTKWEKIDIYFFSKGVLIDRYLDKNPRPSSPTTRSFSYQAGFGLEFEIKENDFIFYETYGNFRNQFYLGRQNKVGFRYRF